MRIVSVHHERLLVNVRSNLANQILIFSDEELSCTAENVNLEPDGEVTVYVCMLVPVAGKKDSKFINAGFGSVTLWDEYNKGVSRELVVGITVDVLDADTRESIVQQSLTMKGRIGKSVLRISQRLIDLGTSTSLGSTLTSSFVISNHSDFLPLRYAVMSPPGLSADVNGGELDGRKISEGCNSVTVTVTFKVTEFGMYNKPIVVSNLSANQYWSMYEEKDEIYVQHFAEQGWITSKCFLANASPSSVETPSEDAAVIEGTLLFEGDYALPSFVAEIIAAHQVRF
jgi:hypothetical protein